MKTNLSSLMSIVDEKERNFLTFSYNLKSYAVNTSTQELNGTVNVTEDYKEDFEKEFEEYKETQKQITKLKAIIHQKNNELKLSDGRTIQEAIIDNSNLRKMKTLYKSLLSIRNLKRRITEVNNSYFECRTMNFDIKELQKEYEELEKRIQNTDFEISKLNSIEFEVNI